MNKKYIHLKVLFSQTQPEFLRVQLLYPRSADRTYQLGVTYVSEACYLHSAHSVPELNCCSQDELRQRCWDLQEILEEGLDGGVLRLVTGYAQDVLHFQNGIPVCRQEYLFSWRDFTLDLGQDLFTCAGLAQADLSDHIVTSDFVWPPIVRTDRVDLGRILERGVAENHYHMNGSTQMFSLSWIFLMNHPEYAKEYFSNSEFKEDLAGTYSFGMHDNRISWPERIWEAAWLRNKLFLVFCGIQNPKGLIGEYRELARSMNKASAVRSGIQNTRLYIICQLKKDEKWKKLDYALWKDGLSSRTFSQSSCRFLSGERYLLYQCFRHCYDGSFSAEVCDLFYLYLLYKIRFRKELIQANNRMGFRNFAEYQDRKALVWGDFDDYWEESCRLSAANTLFTPSDSHRAGQRTSRARWTIAAPADVEERKERCVTSLEMRVMPADTPEKLKNNILQTDMHVMRGLNLPPSEIYPGWKKEIRDYLSEEAPFFYVIHFAKVPLERISKKEANNRIPILRNGKLYHTVERQTKAVAEALRKSSYLCSRIRGIDACNHEIGCRPEVFATAFRYLRSFPSGESGGVMHERYHPLLHGTYHAGEDFLDLADGLRAIDEAICFLNLESGERLGHALALGTLPQRFYKRKGRSVVLPAQDLLDNVVWLLYRTVEWDVPMPGSLRNKLEVLAKKLLDEIYSGIWDYVRDELGTMSFERAQECKTHTVSLDEYYNSWKLRGDDPKLYYLAIHSPKEFFILMERYRRKDRLLSSYQCAQINRMKWSKPEELNEKDWDHAMFHLRKNPIIQSVTYAYFYDPKVRYAGQQEQRFPISDDYIQMIYALQNSMMEKISKRGIAIECNPSSNALIGSFGPYQYHPIFRFNHAFLPLKQYADQSSQLNVSVNTDDLGVFDTSLENEYALLYSALQEYTDENGKQLIGNTTICTYLETLRGMGLDMAFPRANRSAQKRQLEKESTW